MIPRKTKEELLELLLLLELRLGFDEADTEAVKLFLEEAYA